MLLTISLQCIVITEDDWVHVANDVEIVDRDALTLDLKEYPRHEAGALSNRSNHY